MKVKIKNVVILILLIISITNCSSKKEIALDKNYSEKKITEVFKYDKNKIITALHINFTTENKNVLKDLEKTFGESSENYIHSKEIIKCNMLVHAWGYCLLDYKFDEFCLKNEKLVSENYYNNVLLKQTEKWERIDDKPTPKYDYISLEDLKNYLEYFIYSTENKIDTTKYTWFVDNATRHPEDYYKGIYCKFTTYHCNERWDWEYNPKRKDFCMVSERNSDKIIDWIPLKEGTVIKGDNYNFNVKKIIFEEIFLSQAKELLEVLKIAEKYNLKLSKDNDV